MELNEKLDLVELKLAKSEIEKDVLLNVLEEIYIHLPMEYRGVRNLVFMSLLEHDRV